MSSLSQTDNEKAMHSALEKVMTRLSAQMLREVRREVQIGVQEFQRALGSQTARPVPELHSAELLAKLQHRPSFCEEIVDDATSPDLLQQLAPEKAKGREASERGQRLLGNNDGYLPLTSPQELCLIEGSKSQILDNSAKEPLQGAIAGFVKSSSFEWAAGVLVLVNAIFVGYETNLDCLEEFHTLGVRIGEFLFMCLFLTEWLLRVYVYGSQWFCMERWYVSFFDTFMVSSQVLDQIVSLASIKGVNLSLLGIVRILRLLRILRLVRLLHLFDELGMLVDSISDAASALCWAVLLMFTLIYACSIFFARMTLQAATGANASQDLSLFFGDVPHTFLTLLECIIGGVSWGEPVMVLFHEVNAFTAIAFICCITVGLFVLVNVVTGVFINKAMETAKREKKDHAIAGVRWVFASELDKGHVITFDMFQKKIDETPEMVDYLKEMDMSPCDARQLFDILDSDGSGSISSAKLVAGCERLKGPARSLDVAQVVQNHQRMSGEIESSHSSMHDQLAEHYQQIKKVLEKVDSSREELSLYVSGRA